MIFVTIGFFFLTFHFLKEDLGGTLCWSRLPFFDCISGVSVLVRELEEFQDLAVLMGLILLASVVSENVHFD